MFLVCYKGCRYTVCVNFFDERSSNIYGLHQNESHIDTTVTVGVYLIPTMKLFRHQVYLLALLLVASSILAGCDQTVPANQYQSELPAPLSLAEPVLAGGCPVGGIRLYHGLDYNHDGRLGIYERHHEELICNPTPLGVTPATGVALGKPKVQRPEDG